LVLWYTSVILAVQEAEAGRIKAQASPEKTSKILSQNKNKRAGVVASGGQGRIQSLDSFIAFEYFSAALPVPSRHTDIQF
jgi:hypothetical protein